jgi:hypothetical protein
MGLMKQLELMLEHPDPLLTKALSNLGLDRQRILEALREVRLAAEWRDAWQYTDVV